MRFMADDNLLTYDVFPKVFVAGKPSAVHIRPQGRRPQFEPGQSYGLVICALDGGNPKDFPSTGDFRSRTVVADAEGGFTFEHTFDREQEYFIRLQDGEGKKINQFPVYCVEQDLAGRYPFLGDLHMHTLRSDGSQEPKVVCANYRRYGYDFCAITDHSRYYPSLEAIEFYRDVPTEFNIVPGEEVHPQPVDGMTDDVHIVNFGGEYSVNALVEGVATGEKGTDWRVRSLREDCPAVMSKEEYDGMIRGLCAAADLPEGVDPYPAVGCKWVFDQIRKANGLGIFAHPNWIKNVFHVPERLTDYIMETQMFDAFEVLNGVSNYETNGFQTARYYEERAKGRRFPVVGSTDSHNSLPSNPIRLSSCTIVFSPENERKALIRSVRDMYSVAVDAISKEFRLVGEARFIRYGCFLLKNFFPLHDDLCEEEGRMMKQYACGTAEEKEDALKVLGAINGRMKRQREKYFSF